jgi:hypothetical protein
MNVMYGTVMQMKNCYSRRTVDVGKFQNDKLKPVAEEMKVSTRNCLVCGSLPVEAVFVCDKNELVLPLTFKNRASYI